MKHGFIKVAAATPAIRVADPAYNAQQIIDCIREADDRNARVVVFPELCLTGATCGDLVMHRHLLDGAVDGLGEIVRASKDMDLLAFVGMPFSMYGRLYSVAAVVYKGELIALVPRTNVEGTRFSAPDDEVTEASVRGLGTVCVSADMLFECAVLPGLMVSAQLGADRDMPCPPAVRHAAAGATLIVELASFPMSIISTRDARRDMISDSSRLNCGWVLAAPGTGESTTDKVYSGLRLIVEKGEVLELNEDGCGIVVSEIDIEYLLDARRRAKTFKNAGEPHLVTQWGEFREETTLTRSFPKTPFVPRLPESVPEFCERALRIQVDGLIKRMETTGLVRPVIGVSGGVDSTLVLLACAAAMDKMGLPRSNIVAITMPCFGTTDRTKSNAIIIAEELGTELRIVPIGEAVKKHFEIIGHDFDDHSVVFENAQARERTMVLLDVANKVGGLDVGTKDLSEQADGWCTYNGDQISNYDINAGLTKSMVRIVVKYCAEKCENKALKDALLDIVDTPVTPELLPISESGELIQKSEDSVGPYDLQDFFLWHMMMRGAAPEKVLRLAEYAFGDEYDHETLIKWLRSYSLRLFTQQFKRSATADGPGVAGFTFSPRDGFKMPSDASHALWTDAVDKLPKI